MTEGVDFRGRKGHCLPCFDNGGETILSNCRRGGPKKPTPPTTSSYTRLALLSKPMSTRCTIWSGGLSVPDKRRPLGRFWIVDLHLYRDCLDGRVYLAVGVMDRSDALVLKIPFA